jgi:hypothetical protein
MMPCQTLICARIEQIYKFNSYTFDKGVSACLKEKQTQQAPSSLGAYQKTRLISISEENMAAAIVGVSGSFQLPS